MTRRALLIDDSRAMRMLLGNQVRTLGFEVTEAGDGSQALAVLCADADFELVLVDWNMPVMNGLEFIRAVRAHSRYCHLCIVVITSETEVSQMVTALTAGANEYLMKPFSRDALGSKLELLGILHGAT
jgi:two-component system chemotaxis response regulator CheY